ncbi:DUF2000 domain-containing protein [Saccharopolyspora taberi]|uniref:DUF2000 domain-containing protein n=1 Tax=Saccharopolyspora taberi TaxID=60895 RepID=A0ABN3VF12_9PSEU
MATDTKIAVVIRKDLPEWQKLNVTAFLAGGIAASAPELIGQDYADASGVTYLPLFGQPVLVFAAGAEELKRTHERAIARDVRLTVYTEDMFRTGNDADNRAVVAAVETEDLDLVGIAMHARRNTVDKVCKGLSLHP